MGTTTSNDSVSMKTLQSLLPYATILVSIALSWGNLSSKIDLLGQKTDSIVDVATTTNRRLDTLASQQQEMALKLNTLATIIESAQARGLLSQARTSAIEASIAVQSTPTPTPEPNKSESPQVVVNNTTENSSKEPEKEKPDPTQPPQSQEPRPTQVPEFVNTLLSDVLGSLI